MKPTILFILHLPPPVHGAAMMGKYIHDSKLINEAFDCHYINLTTAKSLQDIGKGGVRKLWTFFCLLIRIIKAVVRLKPAMAYVTPNACGGPFYKDFVVVQMLKLLGCKVIVHYHNKGVSTRQDKRLDNWLYRHFFKGIKVILLAEALYKDVEKYVDRKDVYICPNGIPETAGDTVVPKRDHETPRLLFLSNLLESKGVLVLLDACRILKDKGYSFVCDFVGGETAEIDAERFKEEVNKRGLNSITVYNGKKYGEEKQEFFFNSDIFVSPTSNDCFPLVLLEAMESGLPIVTTEEGGIPDIVKDGENGLICERNNADSVAKSVGFLLNDEEKRKSMGERGYELFKTNNTLAAFEQKFAEVIEKAHRGG